MLKNIVRAVVMYIWTVNCLLNATSTLNNEIQEDAWYNRIERYCLAPLTGVDEDYPHEPYYEHLMRCMDYQRNPGAEKRKRAAFQIIKQEQKKISDALVLNDPMTWQDLCLFNGKLADKKTRSLVDIIDRTRTDLGNVMLACMLVQPKVSIEEIEARKGIIQKLLENPSLLEKLVNALDRFKKAEALLLSFWMSDPLKQPLERHYYNLSPKVKRLNKLLNNSVVALDLKSNLEHAKRYLFFGAAIVAAVILPFSGIALIAEGQEPSLYKRVIDISRQQGLSDTEKINFIKSMTFQAEHPSLVEQLGKELKGTGGPVLALISATIKNKNVSGMAAVIAGMYCALSAKEDYEWARDNVVLDMCIQEKMIAVAEAFSILKEINSCTQILKDYKKALRCGNGITEFLDTKGSNTSTKKRLLNLLTTPTFKGKPAPFSRTGRILIAYASMHTIKTAWSSALATIAELDVFVSMALLYKEFQHQPNHYCFVNFVTASQPMLNIQEFWNPCIDAGIAVANSLHVGGHEKNNIILTGPNAGGKSTLLRALGINILLAQTFGIAAAQTMHVTPFTVFGTYFNMVDDLAQGKSLFKAEMMRAHDLVEKIENLKQGQFGFILADELFKGTGPKEAEAAAYSVVKHIGSNNKTLSIVASHFPLLTTLEQVSDNFMNYKISVNVTSQGNICYPFKLEPGSSEQHIALALLRSHGFSRDILNDAYDIVGHVHD